VVGFETGAAPGLGDYEPLAGARLIFNQPVKHLSTATTDG
jgi:hypothetical protein